MFEAKYHRLQQEALLVKLQVRPAGFFLSRLIVCFVLFTWPFAVPRGNAQQDRVAEELQTYKTAHKDGKKALRDVCTQQTAEGETRARHLRDKQKVVADAHDGNLRQLQMWRDLAALMAAKTAGARGDADRAPADDRLVL